MAMDIRKRNYSVRRKKTSTWTQLNQGDGKYFPAIAKKYSLENRKKTNASLNHLNSKRNKLNQLKTTFCLPRINVNREPFSIYKKSHSHSNLRSTSTINNISDGNTSMQNSFETRKVNFTPQDAKKTSRWDTDLTSTQRLLKSLRIVDHDKGEKKTRFQRENSLNICRMELIPRCTKKPKIKAVPVVQKLSRTELHVAYPTLRLTSTDKSAIFFSSPSISFSMESLDSIVGGTLSLTRPPPDMLSSCSPSEIEFTPPSTP